MEHNYGANSDLECPSRLAMNMYFFELIFPLILNSKLLNWIFRLSLICENLITMTLIDCMVSEQVKSYYSNVKEVSCNHAKGNKL